MNRVIEVVQEAGKNRVGIGHFNIADLVLLKGVFQAARELNGPVKLGDEALMNTCFSCHNQAEARDLVFTRYAP
jgi:fructose/tagatose bisphosphate aldolase